MSGVDVLAAMDAIANGIHSPNEGDFNCAHHTLIDFCLSRDAVAELIDAASEVADEHMGLAATTNYIGEDDEVGERACCGVLSYAPHTKDCPAARLRAAIAACKVSP